MDKLLFRRQFILTNRKIEVDKDWIEYNFQSDLGLHLYSHPDLNIEHAHGEAYSAYLIGYLFDPFNPASDNQNLLIKITNELSLTSILALIHAYTGRFCLIIIDKNQKISILTDFTSFRSLYYYFNNQTIALGSSPDILSKKLNVSKTKNSKINEFYASQQLKQSGNIWIGYDTIYEGIKQLPPNHILNISNRTLERFWPDNALPQLPYQRVVAEIARILKGTIEASVRRYKTHVAITAGWDTRLLLAATKDFQDDIFYYINIPDDSKKLKNDLRIARKIASALDIELNEIHIDPCEVEQKFKSVYFKNHFLARNELLPIFYRVYLKQWEDTYTLSGTMGNGLARSYMSFPKNHQPSGRKIAHFQNYNNLHYATQALDDWIVDVKPLCDRLNIDIMDLYQLEQDNAHWASLSATEQDIAREEIRPFNNRYLISLFWSLDKKHRYQYYPQIYIDVIDKLWPKLNKFPINPSFRGSLYKILRVFGLEQNIYHFYQNKKIVTRWK